MVDCNFFFYFVIYRKKNLIIFSWLIKFFKFNYGECQNLHCVFTHFELNWVRNYKLWLSIIEHSLKIDIKLQLFS